MNSGLVTGSFTPFVLCFQPHIGTDLITDHQTAEFHCFKRLGKPILFNVETLLAYEVSPVVFDVVNLLNDATPTDPTGELTRRHSMDQIGKAVNYLKREGFLPNGPETGLSIRHLKNVGASATWN